MTDSHQTGQMTYALSTIGYSHADVKNLYVDRMKGSDRSPKERRSHPRPYADRPGTRPVSVLTRGCLRLIGALWDHLHASLAGATPVECARRSNGAGD